MSSYLSTFSNYLTPPVQIAILCLTVIAIRAFFALRKKDDDEVEEKVRKAPPPMEKRDFNLEELKPYNGVEQTRILIAVNGKVFDVTKGHNNYGPGLISLFAFVQDSFYFHFLFKQNHSSLLQALNLLIQSFFLFFFIY